MEIMMIGHGPWDEHQHRSSLANSVEDNLNDLYLPNLVKPFTNFISIHEVDSEKNLSNIEEMMHSIFLSNQLL